MKKRRMRLAALLMAAMMLCGLAVAEPVHEHQWSAWQKSADHPSQETRTCLECSAVETREHEWGAWIDQGDGTEKHIGDPTETAIVAAALRAAAERGCDVRLLMDGVGSFHLWPSWRKRLGPDVKLAYFLPPRLIPPQFSINLRTHRKVLICDSETGFTGGMNISQNHLANLKRRSRVQDVHFRCLGPIAQQLEIAFLMDWSFATGDHTNFTVHPVKKQGSSLCRILMDGPGTPEDTILDLVCAQISAARHSVRIMSPYFLPPHRLHGELVSAVLRGVDVSVILPGENNHRLVDWAMRHQMPMLADRGVKIYRQPPPFAHTKLLLIDGEYTLLGSANLDPRSLNLNFELVMEVLDLRLAEQLSAFYDEVRSRSVSVPTTYPALPYRLRNAASWIFSPYL